MDFLNYETCCPTLGKVREITQRYTDSLFGKLNAKVLTALLAFVVLGSISWKSVQAQSVDDLTPKPELTPQQVVEYQLTVLQQNDQPTPDAGIEKAFRFASPANQKSTGPISHFISMVHSSSYAALLNAKEATVTRVQVEDREAKILTRIVSASGSETFYLFLLSKQPQGEEANCWLTDGVIGLQPADDGRPKVDI
jgi:hypothetical protein